MIVTTHQALRLVVIRREQRVKVVVEVTEMSLSMTEITHLALLVSKVWMALPPGYGSYTVRGEVTWFEKDGDICIAVSRTQSVIPKYRSAARRSPSSSTSGRMVAKEEANTEKRGNDDLPSQLHIPNSQTCLERDRFCGRSGWHEFHGDFFVLGCFRCGKKRVSRLTKCFESRLSDIAMFIFPFTFFRSRG